MEEQFADLTLGELLDKRDHYEELVEVLTRGKGITMCEEWRRSFTKFYAFMGMRPWAEMKGLPTHLVSQRLRRGWDVKRALLSPQEAKKYRKRKRK